jgi:hypothetical protein
MQVEKQVPKNIICSCRITFISSNSLIHSSIQSFLFSLSYFYFFYFSSSYVFDSAAKRIDFGRIEFERIDFDKIELKVNWFMFGYNK